MLGEDLFTLEAGMFQQALNQLKNREVIPINEERLDLSIIDLERVREIDALLHEFGIAQEEIHAGSELEQLLNPTDKP
jgi:lysyl-tRNA synthetase class II